mmetsp:Transcript_43462/g.91296  ORF Transcript_43462/g.91296 Transcript_43462/m.91296 type:complete len:605 (+) Transcript_43462:230-2044(+)|eukprot:CAMPEP_0183742310 /NCGR_PEP_ID=MMETSP0737-20130205/64423_1 /TAXON_ID=385413 /ORGANISM="Thalassiosira miniscula, Strain CCMP1093" /LENGTH=604 /DNA_ID=CAMNT_0025977877 /DNA_START=195 /DNA_END=2009 /DNA_ORIENTATION=+
MKKKQSSSRGKKRSTSSTAAGSSGNESADAPTSDKFPAKAKFAICSALLVGAVEICRRVVHVVPTAEEVGIDTIPNDDFCNDTSEDDLSYDAVSRVSDKCTLVMAPSGIPGGGWGVFTLTPRKPGQHILDQGDIVIHIPDPNPKNAHGMKRFKEYYVWDGQETGGHYEGVRVTTAISGFGALPNGLSEGYGLIRGTPSVEDAGATRGHSPGAGAFSHYHDLKWTVNGNLNAGDEIFLEYGSGWFDDRGYDTNISPKKRNVTHLRDVGYCLDNIAPGRSLIKDAGRGAFASRDLEKGAVIAPVPLIALSRSSLEIFKADAHTGALLVSTQLLENYCFGHEDSSLLLYPYSHGINFINHGSRANARLRWWAGSRDLFDKSPSELQQSLTSQLMMELVATRPIDEGEEILLDYGHDWVDAWTSHVKAWRSRDKGTYHVSAETMNHDAKHFILRTRIEQKTNPYPEDVFTSCYYKYSDHAKENPPISTDEDDSTPQRSVAPWKHEMMKARNLRPCIIVKRDEVATNDDPYVDAAYDYIVQVYNRPSLDKEEQIPDGQIHYASNVPRHAIVFSDKIYTTDQHLENAFRKEIGLGNLFPDQWKDASSTQR